MSRHDNPAAGFGAPAGLDGLQRTIQGAGIRNFSAAEVCRLNPARIVPPEPTMVVPPKDFWPSIIPTLRLAERMRAAWVDDVKLRGGHVTRAGIAVVSGYRPPWYNARVGGALQSQHMRFTALDLRPVNGELGHFMRVASMTVASERDLKAVGYGRYDTFIHIDTGRNVFTQWDNRSQQAKARDARFAVGGDKINDTAPEGE
jgi:hypothetical protein